MGFVSFVFGIIIASILIIFAPEIKNLMVSSGLRDFIVEWIISRPENHLVTNDQN